MRPKTLLHRKSSGTVTLACLDFLNSQTREASSSSSSIKSSQMIRFSDWWKMIKILWIFHHINETVECRNFHRSFQQPGEPHLMNTFIKACNYSSKECSLQTSEIRLWMALLQPPASARFWESVLASRMKLLKFQDKYPKRRLYIKLFF